jgi:hypothetical protein
MKKYLVFLLGFILISCSDNENIPTEINSSEIPDKSQLLDATLEEQIKYKKHHMKIISKWIANYGADLINSENKSSNEFLVEELVSKAVHQKKFSNDENTYDDLFLSLDAFKDLGEEHSWIPIVRKIDRKLLNKNADSLMIISVEDADVNGEKFTHYLPGENDDDLIEADFPVTPETTQGHNNFVIELTPVYGVGTGGGNTGSYTRLELDDMKIKDLNEGWPGRSEITFRGYKRSSFSQNTHYNCGESIYASVNCYNNGGNRITRLKRRHKNDMKNYDWEIERFNNFNNDVLYYVIYEEDFPAPKHTEFYSLPNGATSTIEYYSWQSKYDKQILTNNNLYQQFSSPNNFSENNSDIEYNLNSIGF